MKIFDAFPNLPTFWLLFSFTVTQVLSGEFKNMNEWRHERPHT